MRAGGGVQPDSMEGCRTFEQRRRGFCEGCRAEISIEGVVRAFRRKRRRRRAPFGRVAERPENVGDLGGGLTLFEHPSVSFDGRTKREKTQSARSFLGSISRVSARKNPKKIMKVVAGCGRRSLCIWYISLFQQKVTAG
jgi:hypothetical protein